jgi:hypothetical protein
VGLWKRLKQRLALRQKDLGIPVVCEQREAVWAQWWEPTRIYARFWLGYNILIAIVYRENMSLRFVRKLEIYMYMYRVVKNKKCKTYLKDMHKIEER